MQAGFCRCPLWQIGWGVGSEQVCTADRVTCEMLWWSCWGDI